jgi:hypothetical protein
MGKDEETKELVGTRTKNLKYGFQCCLAIPTCLDCFLFLTQNHA